MNDRAYSLDALRALAIIGMVFSGYIAWNADLPAWLFHAQTPPPSFAFNSAVAGITWVDLVFPFFLFSMGAALPWALGRKLDKGVARMAVAGSILKRGLLLVFFAIALGNTSMGLLDAVSPQPLVNALLTMIVWCALFAMFIRLPQLSKSRNNWLNAAGILAVGGMLGLYGWLGVAVSLYQSNIIMLILANMVVAGSFIWWFTRRNLWLRLGIIALIVALKIGATVPDSWNAVVWNGSFVPWLYHTEFLQYLCILLPGSIVGDLILHWQGRRQPSDRLEQPLRTYAAMTVVVLLFLVNMWSLFTRSLEVNFALTAALGAAAWWLLRTDSTPSGRLLYKLFTIGFFWLLLGLTFESFEGGIKKDFATVSYLFVTAGLATHLLLVATLLLDCLHWRASMLIGCGQNPMIAYTVGGYVIMPLLVLVDRVVALPWLWGGCGCGMSVIRSVIITTLMMLLTAAFSRWKLFWRS